MAEEMTGRKKPVSQAIRILQNSDIATVQQQVKAMAQALGFDERGKEELAIAVSELASNLLKYAGQGTLTLSPLREGKRTGIQIESADNGPGIANVGQAITDGFSTVGSLGYGLGAVNRLTDEFDIASQPLGGRGARIVCKRWRPVDAPTVMPCPLDIGAATRPHPAQVVNGDTFLVQRWSESALVGVIDGVGHGQFAYRAAQTARLYVENHFDQHLKAIFSGVGRACRGTQGVVMALAWFDWGQARLTFASVGNVESRVFACAEKINFIVRRGVIGLNAPDPVVTEHRWEPTQVMVLHSDGLTTHWQWENFPQLQNTMAAGAAQELLHRLARDDDDATVVVVKGAQHPRGMAKRR